MVKEYRLKFRKKRKVAVTEVVIHQIKVEVITNVKKITEAHEIKNLRVIADDAEDDKLL